jgi:AraC-like DNA-binding protein
MDANMTNRYSLQLIEAHLQSLDYHWDNKTYCSSAWHYYHNESAGAAIGIGGNWTELLPDRCYLIAPGTTFQTRQQRNPIQFYMHFTCGQPFDGAQEPLYSFPLDARMREDMALVIAAIRIHGNPFTPLGIARALSLGIYALSFLDEHQISKEFQDPRIERLVLQIRAYPHDRLSIADMANFCHMSEGGFTCLFKKNTGITPHAFVLECRIRKAKYLLTSTDIPIDEITHLCGFEDRFHFSRTFKRITEKSPAAYRQHQ